ncbi:MAG TPA: winged helix-turn-helix domain-containing protein, partial [Lysobacter sp.]|nr:winged helix-turn-helix domain-containing protein [Lysobacter sp.]
MGALRFDAFTLDVPGGVLLRGGKEISLRPQSLKVLAYLAERSGQIITNTELIESCWENPKQTNSNSLSQCINDIREALGDADHRMVRTVPRRGYTFAAPVTTVPSPAPGPIPPASIDTSAPFIPGIHERGSKLLGVLRQRWHAPAALLMIAMAVAGWMLWNWASRPAELTMMATPSIAVLPFKLVGDAASTLAGDIETELSRAPRAYSLRIRSASGCKISVENLRTAGRELGVRYLVLGSNRREGGIQQANVQLIEAESGRQVWAEPFNYAPDEAGAQNLAAKRIARLLNVQVLRAEARLPLPARPQAGHFVILGRGILENGRGMEANRRAKAWFDKARDPDPDSIPALNGYGRTRVDDVLNEWAPKEQRPALLDEAEAAIDHAISVDPRIVGTYVLQGTLFRTRGKDAEAMAAFERALSLQDDLSLAHAELGRIKIEVGLADQSVAHIERAIRLSSNDPYIYAWYYWAGMAEAHLGHYERAIEWFLKARRANQASKLSVPWLAVSYAALDKMSEARTYLEEARAIWPDFSISSWNASFPRRYPTVRAQRARIETIFCELGV